MLSIVQTIKKKILDVLKAVQSRRNQVLKMLTRILPLIAFLPPFLILYSLYPASFEATWEGRTFYLFFVWLVSLEIILNWDKVLELRVSKARQARTIAFIIVLLLPTIYIIVANYFGINDVITDWAKYNVHPDVVHFVRLSTEYLVLTVFFALIVSLGFGIGRLKDFALSTLFLGAIGLIYTINNFYPYGRFTPFQILVPTTTRLSASVLNLMGHPTTISEITHPTYGWLTVLYVLDPKTGMDLVSFGVAWPCAGVESLIIYTVTILVFLKGSAISWKHKVICFAVGAIVTYFINVLRIVTIFTLALQYGQNSPQVLEFHNYYGQLYSITWIIFYPLIIIGSQHLWNRFQRINM